MLHYNSFQMYKKVFNNVFKHYKKVVTESEYLNAFCLDSATLFIINL